MELTDPAVAIAMYVYLSKVLPLFLLPPGIGFVVFAAALVLLLKGRTRAAAWLSLSALCMLWIAALPVVAANLYGRLESRFPPEPLSRVPACRCVVVLGGAVEMPLPPRQDIELSEGIDRIYRAAQLYRTGKANRVFIAAGNQPWVELGPSEASLIGELLVEWGVPPDAIQLEGHSRNTRENAVNIKPLLDAAGCDRSLLVTSAAHMPRALDSFRAVGLDVYPVSTDVRVVRSSGFALLGFVPDAHALAMTSDALREWMGQKVYEWRGWN